MAQLVPQPWAAPHTGNDKTMVVGWDFEPVKNPWVLRLMKHSSWIRATDGDLASDQAMGQKPSALVNLKHLIWIYIRVVPNNWDVFVGCSSIFIQIFPKMVWFLVILHRICCESRRSRLSWSPLVTWAACLMCQQWHGQHHSSSSDTTVRPILNPTSSQDPGY